MLALFLGVLRELRLHAVARNPGSSYRMHRVAQHAHDLGGKNRLQNLDRLVHVANIGSGTVAALQMLARALA